MRDAAATARAVAAFGLPGTTIEPPGAIEPQDWPLTLAQLEHEKLTGIAVAAAEVGWLPVKADQFEDVVDRHREAMAWCLGLERLLLDVADAFEREGVEFLVLKGPAVARVAYPDPSWRVFHDLDLLVRTEDWRRAVAALERDFGPRRIAEPRLGWDERFGKGAVFLVAGGRQVDLHRTLVKAPFALWVRPEDLFEAAEAVEIAGETVRHPDGSALFVHAAAHAMLGDDRPRLHGLRDIAQLATGSIDWQRVEHLAATWRLRTVLVRSIGRSASTLGITPADGVRRLAASRGDVRERAATVAFSSTAPRWAPAAVTLAVTPTIRGRWEFARATMGPRQRLARGAMAHQRAPARPTRSRETDHGWTST